MTLSFHWIPARNGGNAEEELNHVLRSRCVVGVEKHFCPVLHDPGWAVCVDYVDAGREGASSGKDSNSKRESVDYREVFEPPDFAIFAALRHCRKELAAADGVPAYAIMTNEQLAAMVRSRCKTLSEIGAINGVGEARVRKYGERFLSIISAALARQSEADEVPAT